MTSTLRLTLDKYGHGVVLLDGVEVQDRVTRVEVDAPAGGPIEAKLTHLITDLEVELAASAAERMWFTHDIGEPNWDYFRGRLAAIEAAAATAERARYRFGWCCDFDFDNGTYRTSDCISSTRNADAVEREAATAERERIAAALPEALAVLANAIWLDPSMTREQMIAHPAVRAILEPDDATVFGLEKSQETFAPLPESVTDTGRPAPIGADDG